MSDKVPVIPPPSSSGDIFRENLRKLQIYFELSRRLDRKSNNPQPNRRPIVVRKGWSDV